MNPSLDELAQYVRKTLPQSGAMQNLLLRTDVGALTFRWNTKDFLVKPSLEVFELKGPNVHITGSSVLMQTMFVTKHKNQQGVAAAIETLRQAEDYLNARQTDRGCSLLASVKQTLTTLAGKPLGGR